MGSSWLPMISKSFTDHFVRRPVIAMVVNIAILVVGAVAYFQLNTRQYPRSDAAVVNITTVYYGASADTVRGYITTQLERVIASADGIDYLESTSAANVSTIRVFLRLNYDFTVERLYAINNPSAAERLTVIDVGGYGRGEMALHSDVDLAFLTRWKQTSWSEQDIESMLYSMWDLGLKVVH